eukprot:m.122036 g.122036  ORF g.122036 m.122036 type:complete len:325 (+) comp28897_c1_seq1:34-1008(+)
MAMSSFYVCVSVALFSLVGTSSAYIRFVGQNVDASIDAAWKGSNPFDVKPSLTNFGETGDSVTTVLLPTGSVLTVGNKIVMKGAMTRIILRTPSDTGETRIRFTNVDAVAANATQATFLGSSSNPDVATQSKVTCSNNYYSDSSELPSDFQTDVDKCNTDGLEPVIFKRGSTILNTTAYALGFASLSVVCTSGNCTSSGSDTDAGIVTLGTDTVNCFKAMCATGIVQEQQSTGSDGLSVPILAVVIAFPVVLVLVGVGYLLYTRKLECSKRQPDRAVHSFGNPLYDTETAKDGQGDTAETPDDDGVDTVPEAVQLEDGYLDVET